MKIVCIIDDLQVGGTEKGLLVLSRHLPRDVELSVVALFGHGGLAEKFRAEGVEVKELNCSKLTAPLAFARLTWFLRSNSPDAVVGMRIMSRICAVASGKVAGVPVICLRWGSSPGAEGDRWLRAERWAVRHANRFSAGCRAISRDLEKVYGIQRERVWVIPPPIAEETDVPERRGEEVEKALGIPKPACVIGTVANLNWRKDYPTLIRAASTVEKEVPEVHFVIVGEGADRPKLENMVTRLGLKDRVHFLGYRDDIPDLLGAMDMFALTSVTEGLSAAVREAMQAGLSCVVTRVGGLKEIIDHGETGLLVSPGKPDEVAEALLKLIRNPKLRRSLGTAAQQKVGTEYGADLLAQRFVRMCECCQLAR
ncbi:MAG: glycosyltransferase [Candidatus Brocadiia bacterium]